MAISIVIALALLLPLGLLGLDARAAGWSEIHRVLFRERSLYLLQHTVVISVLVVFFAAVIGVAAAWCTERARLPGRRAWTVFLVLPVAIPDFVVGYAWHSIDPTINGLVGATLVMTLGTYPLVYLPVAAALRRTDPAMEDTAHSLGAGRVSTFFRVTLPLVRTAVLGGSVLVFLTVISEYGVFEILRYQTFTTEIFTEFQFDSQAAGALAVPLVCLGLLVLAVDGIIPRRAATSAGTRRVAVPPRLRRAAASDAGGARCARLPRGGRAHRHAVVLDGPEPAHHPAGRGHAGLGNRGHAHLHALGALIAVVLALPVAMMSFRRSSAPRVFLERSTYVTQALPGVVVALSLVFFATHYAYALYQTSVLLVAAYAILHFPLALVCVKTSVAQAPARLADVGQSLGRGPTIVFLRVTFPLLIPGLLAGFCLVFLTAVTELTATLELAPIGVQTLATQFWAYQSEVAYGAAAPYTLVIVALAMIPGALLGLWFDRERHVRASLGP